MAISTDEIRTIVEKYLAEYPDEAERLERLNQAMDEPAESAGHVTSAAVLIDPRWQVLHIYHPARQRWLLPSGHLLVTDESLPDTAVREVYIQTGIVPDTLFPLPGFEITPIDIDVHRRPAARGTGEPGHWHFEMRHAFQIAGSPTIQLAPDDPGQPTWLVPEAVPGFALRLKLRAIHQALVQP